MLSDILLTIPETTCLGRFIRLNGNKIILRKMIKKNIHKDEIVSFHSVKGYPTFITHDGTRLSAFERKIEYFKDKKIPSRYFGVVLDYITRYKYPHFMPNSRIRTGVIPRTRFPILIHPQHKNTLYEQKKR